MRTWTSISRCGFPVTFMAVGMWECTFDVVITPSHIWEGLAASVIHLSRYRYCGDVLCGSVVWARSQELGYPWVMRKMLTKYGSKSTDIVRQKGSSMTVTTVNAKGSWTRTLATDKTLQQVPSLQLPRRHGRGCMACPCQQHELRGHQAVTVSQLAFECPLQADRTMHAGQPA